MSNFATQDDLLAAIRAMEDSRAQRETQQTSTEPWASHLAEDTRSDQALALDILTREYGGNRARAAEALALDQGLIDRPAVKAEIQKEREAFQSVSEWRAKKAWEASPDGRAEAGRKLLAEQEAKAEQLLVAEALLKESGDWDPEDSEDTKLQLAGLSQPEPDPTINDLAANRAAAESDLAADTGTE